MYISSRSPHIKITAALPRQANFDAPEQIFPLRLIDIMGENLLKATAKVIYGLWFLVFLPQTDLSGFMLILSTPEQFIKLLGVKRYVIKRPSIWDDSAVPKNSRSSQSGV
jgi:hypothetical protein